MPAIAREKLWTRDFVFGTAVNFLIMVNYYGLMVVVADYAMKTYDAPAATAGLAASIFVIGALIARLFSGRIMDRVGRKRLLIIGAVLEVAFSALYLTGLGLWLLFALRLLHGIAFGTCSTAIGTIVVQTAVNGLGAVSIAAVTAANKVSQLFTCPFDAAGTTMAVYGGQNYGAMKLDRIHRGVRACVLLMFAYSALGLGVLALFGGKLSLLFLDSAESAAVRDQIGLLAQQFLVWNASCYFLLTLVNVLRFLIQGVGFTQQAVFAGVFETIARCFVGFAVVRWIGYTAICLANPAAWLLADCFLVPIYFHDMHLLQRRFAQRRAEA